MPYIKPNDRDLFDDWIGYLGDSLEEEGWIPGHVNYAISRLIGRWFKNESRYHTIAEITGVLENVKQEFYRRVATEYEDAAVEKNGDIVEYRT